MNEKSEALRLAEFCDGNVFYRPAAAELRRQHEEIDQWRVAVTNAERERDIAESQRDALLAIVRRIADQGCVTDDGCGYCLPCEAEAAIKAAEEK